MNNVEKKYIAVDGGIAGAGAATFWTLSGDLNLETFKALWSAAGLPEEWLPEKPSAEVAFRRAVKELEGSDTEVEMVGSTGEWLFQSREEVDGLPVRTPLAKWKLNDDDEPVMTFGDSKDLHDVLLACYSIEKERITSNDISVWLRKLVAGRLDGITLRESGGLYYVPPTNLPVYERAKIVVSQSSAHIISMLPMVKSDEAAATILTALVDKAKVESQKFLEVLEENGSGESKLGHRALRTQAEKAKALHEQMTRYAKMLDAAVPSIAESIDKLAAGLFSAASAAENA